MADNAIDLMGALDLGIVMVAGHDWGSNAAVPAVPASVEPLVSGDQALPEIRAGRPQGVRPHHVGDLELGWLVRRATFDAVFA
ncbi:hypothetical protein [Methylobacterium sp. E-066]|uniref:hypothetical protein n=1 Tax=Methylobacterium sp. E-066 TaxID=2836584 RepID=UPI001FBA9962|nr:hypothetical protein [Methylobacterium sp. E-066]MCJ2141798.1 hypothetical protein [Methylobacterium sp. E-066]